MVNNFAAREAFDNMVQYAMNFEHDLIKIGDRYYRRKNEVLSPSEALPQYYYHELRADWSVIFCWIQHNAEIMRWTLVDESIPLESKEKSFDIFDGCRRTNAIALGMLKYWPALPELREVMLHEYDDYLKEICIDAIGEIGLRAYPYRKDLREFIKSSNNPFSQEEAVKALTRLKDKECVPLLRELFYETVYKIKRIPHKEMFSTKNSGLVILLERILQAFIDLDPEIARECLAVGLISENDAVRHYSKRAFVLSKDIFQMRLMDRNPSAILGFLPKDQSYRYIIRP